MGAGSVADHDSNNDDLPANNNNDNNNDAPDRDRQPQAQEACLREDARTYGASTAPALGTAGALARILSFPRTSGRVSCARSRDT